MTRPARARVDLSALKHNYRVAQKLPGGRALAVLKANAYGHGAVPCARALESLADGFAVAFLDEALALRDAGITTPILVLEGVFDVEELHAAASNDLWVVVNHEAQLRWIEQAHADSKPARVWLKLDTGMHRAGIAPEQVAAAYARLQSCANVQEVVLMSHFARADEPHEPATKRQMELFESATASMPVSKSVCNSAGLIAWPRARQDWARPGIMLYGASPLPTAWDDACRLRPAMTLSSRVFAERWLSTGEALGYGGSFVAHQPTRVGLVAIGYADGYPRSASTGTPVCIDGFDSQIIGRVSMDMLTVDLTNLTQADIGSEVELWGSRVSVNTVAQRANTIAYELLCNVKRVAFEYLS